MDHRLLDALHGQEGNHLLPFLWMHDGRHDELPTLVREIYDSGARALCVESRPHEYFCEDMWWDDMDVVLAEAKKRGMKVWILDDKHFPTGYANGLIAKKYPDRRKWQLVEDHLDVVGPAPESAVLLRVDTSLGEEGDADDVLIGVYAYERLEEAETLGERVIDLSANVCGRYVFWDVPKGVYRVFAIYKSRRGASRTDHIHMIDPESVRVQIEAVYEPHYAHYGKYFGNTIAGFFSDEPSFGNSRFSGGGDTPSMYNQRLGQPGLALPWSDEVLRRMSEALGGEVKAMLAGLWYERSGEGDEQSRLRVAYMDAVTQLWREAFSDQLGNWCRERGVMYIGHIIEDMNAHARLGCSGGHYFRALDGQDMAGIDVVLHQIIPGMAHHVHAASCAGGMTDPEFFDYMLARLAASHSHIQPRMKNRAMCEVFGAYGWAEGVPMMRRLMDHMLVRGINYFVPHAFSPKFPDPDCPPHFNAGGHNPQFSAFSKLMRYTNQVTHMLEGATEIVSAAILYHAEAEWSGCEYMLSQKPAKRLLDAQLNYDILPIDAIIEKARVEGGVLMIEDMRYPALIIPYAACLPAHFLRKLAALESLGLRFAFVDGKPEGYAGGRVVALEDVAAYVCESGGRDVALEAAFPLLRFCHVVRENSHVFMFVNESMSDAFAGDVRLPVCGQGVRADLLLDEVFAAEAPDGMLSLKLGCGQSTLLVFGEEAPQGVAPKREYTREALPAMAWTLSLKRAGEEAYGAPVALDALYNVAGPKGDPSFSGTMRYEAEFIAEPGAAGIDLGLVGECVHAWLNGADIGQRIDAPYRYETDGAIKPGKNKLVLEISNNLVHWQPDHFSRYVQISPSGLLGPVKILYR